MLSFIHSNYRRTLTVAEIADAANVSKSECFRCFGTVIGKKPIEYVNEYRLNIAHDLLTRTDMQVSEVCFTCGFNHISYFGKAFKAVYGVTPKEVGRSISATDVRKCE